ncbi:MAG: hypothetical protein DI527_23920 [Chelatococcus sp.]|nr:MAG: hypothetical protein DI527_23920 [Chelatococcus sp.]
MSFDLVLRRTTSEHVPEWDRHKFWDVYCDGLYLGSLAQQMGRSDEPPSWQWSIQLHAGSFGNGVKPRSGQAATRDEAMQAFRAAWDAIRPAIGDEGWALHVEHMRRLG